LQIFNWNTHLVLYKSNPAQTRVTKMKTTSVINSMYIVIISYCVCDKRQQKPFTFYEVLILSGGSDGCALFI